MNSHNTKSTFVFHKTPVATDAGKKKAKVVGSSLIQNSELAIADEVDNGCDPYNTTGQHVIIKKTDDFDR